MVKKVTFVGLRGGDRPNRGAIAPIAKYIFKWAKFFFNFMFETNFSGHNKFWRNALRWLQACVEVKKV